MSEEKRRNTPDDFWDISDLLPKRKSAFGYARATEPVEITMERKKPPVPHPEGRESDTVIKRYIPPNGDSRLSAVRESFERVESYVPKASLIHEVTLKKQKCSYRYYQGFLEDAKRYYNCRGEACEYVPFFSYVPQYNQLNDRQLAYYLWFRDCFARGERIRIDYSYVLLWIFERINLGAWADVERTQELLTELWYAYRKEFPALSGKLAEWICDFSLIHRLPPPKRADGELVSRVPSLKEFYIAMPDYDINGCVKSLLKYCSSYDYHTSKFATEENLSLFDQHVFAAVTRAVSYYSSDGKILSGLAFEDSSLVRDAFAGALCVADVKYRLEVRYCSFSRSNELRFLVGDIIKYAENKIRTYLGIKSKMTVYSIPTDLQRTLDEYFAVQLPGKRAVKPKREVQEYDVLYEVPKKPLSLSDAVRIEQDSWKTTEKLVTAFDEEEDGKITVEEIATPEPPNPDSKEELTLIARLGSYGEAVHSLLDGEYQAIERLANQLGKMPEALADEINEIAFEFYGDALIEECDGGYAVIEDYQEYLKE